MLLLQYQRPRASHFVALQAQSCAMRGSRAVQAVYYNLCDICVSSVASLPLRSIKVSFSVLLARLLVIADSSIAMQHRIFSAAVYTESCCLAGAEAKCKRSLDRGFCCSVSALRSACSQRSRSCSCAWQHCHNISSCSSSAQCRHGQPRWQEQQWQ
jgi:hypothetical protein